MPGGCSLASTNQDVEGLFRNSETHFLRELRATIFVLLQAKEACGLESLARPAAESIKFRPFHFCNPRDNVTIAS